MNSLNIEVLLNIVICTFNASKYLRECLDSIVYQKSKHVKLYIFDGGSTDETLNIITEYAAWIDFSISNHDSGVYDAMNQAKSQIKSGWILYLGADDRLMPNILNDLVCRLSTINNSKTVLYGDVYRPSKNILYDGEYSVYKLLRRNICQQAILYPSSAFEKYSFDIEYKINADHILNIRLFFDSEFEKIYMNVCIAYYEDLRDGLSRNKSDEGFLKLRRELAYKLGGIVPLIFAILIDFKVMALKRLRMPE